MNEKQIVKFIPKSQREREQETLEKKKEKKREAK
jgi:hypothetical protein